MSGRMYVGNAKTYFQPLGKSSSSSGYLMSPFSDDRWDLDDQEKLGKVFRKIETPLKDLNPKSENVQMQKVHPVQRSPSDVLHQKQNFTTNVQTGLPNQTCGGNLDALRREQMFGPAHVLGKGLVQSNRGVLGMSEPTAPHQQQENRQHGQFLRIHETYDLRPREEPPRLCGSCQEKSKSSNDNASCTTSSPWKSSPDVPVLIAGGTSYTPMGPQSPSPNPFFQPQHRNFYSPLR